MCGGGGGGGGGGGVSGYRCGVGTVLISDISSRSSARL